MNSLTLIIPEVLPSLNVTMRLHWRRYAALKKFWGELVMEAKNNAGCYGFPMFERATVHILREGKRLCDEDNLIGGVKCCVDSLRANGIIADDSPAHISLTVEQRKGKVKRTTIRVQRVAELIVTVTRSEPVWV